MRCIRGISLKLTEDYLTGRKQWVRIGDSLSDELTVNLGVQQTSIIGPTLFFEHINELCRLPLLKGKLLLLLMMLPCSLLERVLSSCTTRP